jgi:hypothetical protein
VPGPLPRIPSPPPAFEPSHDAAVDDALDGVLDDLPRSRAPRVESLTSEQDVDLAAPPLTVAVHETGAHLVAALDAIVQTGHEVLDAGNVDRIKELLAGGGVDAVLVALPGGEQIIEAAIALEPHRPVVIASIAGEAVEAVRRATLAGADLSTTRPHDTSKLAPVLFAAQRLQQARRAMSTARGTEASLRAKIEQLAHPEPHGLQPFELFQRVLELELKRARRFEYSISVALFAVDIPPPPPPAGVRGILRARAGNALIHSIRDIDIATELDHERFLVLLPYTPLEGATEVARRIIRAVAECDPVIAANRTFPARVVGSVAGANPGQPLSFSKLMRDASRALDQARKDGAELAVQP